MNEPPSTILDAHFTKRYASNVAIEGQLTMDCDRCEVTALLGPSGCGKTTILRALAGLVRPEVGRIALGSTIWLDAATRRFTPPRLRRVGMLFQDYALFPHMTVNRNVAYGMAQADDRKVSELLERFGLAGMGHRYPHELSGGQQQRVALARTLAAEPKLLLLDEPMAALDIHTRQATRGQLRQMLRAASLPTLLVTHDHDDVMALAHRVIVMDQGRVLQSGAVRDVFNRPVNTAVARIVGMNHVLKGRLIGTKEGMGELEISGRRLWCVTELTTPRPVHVCIHARDVMLQRSIVNAAADSARNHLPARICGITTHGPALLVELDAGFPLAGIITHAAAEELHLEPGQTITAVIKAAAIMIYPQDPS